EPPARSSFSAARPISPRPWASPPWGVPEGTGSPARTAPTVGTAERASPPRWRYPYSALTGSRPPAGVGGRAETAGAGGREGRGEKSSSAGCGLLPPSRQPVTGASPAAPAPAANAARRALEEWEEIPIGYR